MIEITEAGRQLAADLANAEEVKGYPWSVDLVGKNAALKALARLATQSIADKAHTEAIEAQLAEAKADLERIYNLAEQEYGPWSADQSYTRTNGVYRIAAKHRVETDPLVEVYFAAVGVSTDSKPYPSAVKDNEARIEKFRAELAKRGIELAVKS